jgi:hypothetical protein
MPFAISMSRNHYLRMFAYAPPGFGVQQSFRIIEGNDERVGHRKPVFE